MAFFSWSRWLRSLLRPAIKPIRKLRKQTRLRLEPLENRLAPAWTTDWLSDAGRDKLRRFGITPPAEAAGEHVVDASRILRRSAAAICCPRCGSAKTQLVSQFGSTPCKALYRCNACAEPFDYIKPH